MSEQVRKAPWDRVSFLALITFVGGYMNAYTYATRNNTFANMHTSNMSRLGISIANGAWSDALFYFAPILSCILGAAFSELVRKHTSKRLPGDWRKYALLLEAAALVVIGCVPLSVTDRLVTLSVSFFMGYHLCLFRQYAGTPHNTSISTGNLRNVGLMLFGALDKRTPQAVKQLGIFFVLTFSFAFGAIPGTWISAALSIRSVWVCSVLLLLAAVWMLRFEQSEKKA